MKLNWLALALALAGLGGCTMPSGPTTGMSLTPVSLSAIPGWDQDDQAAALASFVRSCAVLDVAPEDEKLGGTGIAATMAGQAGQWRAACAAGRAVIPGDQAAARQFFDADFAAYRIDGPVLLTGYFEPDFPASLTMRPGFSVPLYSKPNDLIPGTPYLTRAQINDGALDASAHPIAWLANPVDAFMLQIQGSGRLTLPDGSMVRVGFDGQNNQPYVPIGRIMVKQGDLAADNVSYQSISAWLKAHPAQAQGLMNQNPRYVFFKILQGVPVHLGPPGALGVPLTPQRSIAVDSHDIPLGTPVFLATPSFDHLTIAQDVGGGINGAHAADLFAGSGPAAESLAGHLHENGAMYLLLPRPAAATPTS